MMNNNNSPTSNPVEQDMNGLPLDQIRLHIGDSIQLQIGNKCYFVTLVGYFKGQSFIVTPPDIIGLPMLPDEGQSIIVRFFCDKQPYTFNAIVKHVTSEPFPHLHLAYPKTTQTLKERQYDRVRVNITGTTNAPDGESISCVVHDISTGGALISLRKQSGAINDTLLLTLRVVVNDVEYELSLDSEIRSVRVNASSSNGDTLILEGLAFNNLSKQDVLALAAFDLLPDWNTTD